MNENQVAIPRVGVEEMVGAGFNCCTNVEKRMICIHVAQLLPAAGKDPKLYCRKVCRPVSVRESLGCTSTRLIQVEPFVAA